MPTLDVQKEAILDIEDDLPHDGDLSFRPMFGGIAAYFNGRIFAILTGLGLALKLEEADREQLLRDGGRLVQFGPEAPVMRQYIFVPESLWANPERFGVWAKRSVVYVRKLPAPQPSKPRKKE